MTTDVRDILPLREGTLSRESGPKLRAVPRATTHFVDVAGG